MYTWEQIPISGAYSLIYGFFLETTYLGMASM